jgi:hypothetical protein
LADEYKVSVKMDAGPFEVQQSEPAVIRKSEIQPAEKNTDEKTD